MSDPTAPKTFDDTVANSKVAHNAADLASKTLDVVTGKSGPDLSNVIANADGVMDKFGPRTSAALVDAGLSDLLGGSWFGKILAGTVGALTKNFGIMDNSTMKTIGFGIIAAAGLKNALGIAEKAGVPGAGWLEDKVAPAVLVLGTLGALYKYLLKPVVDPLLDKASGSLHDLAMHPAT